MVEERKSRVWHWVGVTLIVIGVATFVVLLAVATKSTWDKSIG